MDASVRKTIKNFKQKFFVQNFGAKAETYLEKTSKKDVCMKNSYVKC